MTLLMKNNLRANLILASIALAWTGAGAVYAIGVAVGDTDALFITLGLGTFLGVFLSAATAVGASKSPLSVDLGEGYFVLTFHSKQVKINLSDAGEISGKGILKRDGTRVQCIWLDKIITHELNKALASHREHELPTSGRGI
jgi:hypothetical protein